MGWQRRWFGRWGVSWKQLLVYALAAAAASIFELVRLPDNWRPVHIVGTTFFCVLTIYFAIAAAVRYQLSKHPRSDDQ